MQVSATSPGQVLFVPAADGTRLAITLYLPQPDGPEPLSGLATLLEALPYRMNDITSSYADSYHRYVDEGGFAVVRMDLRGTGNSAGVAEDEYPDIERSDLRDVIRWAATQPWSNGKVGMLGTSYSGFNSLHMAMEGLPELGAVCALYATDDRYTDDVHYMGGTLRALDLIDYPLYMVAMNALPPTPAVWAQHDGSSWVDEWRRRIDQNEPWLLEWLRHPLPDETWRRGSVRTGPDGAGYERFTCPVFLIAGWADGYRNNTFRTLQHVPGTRLLAGPWVHKAPATAIPGPNIDDDLEIMRFFHEHLRGGDPAAAHPAHVFVRRPSPPEPDLRQMDGHWVQADEWPPAGMDELLFVGVGEGVVDTVAVRGDVGVAAWNSCAGGLPWGQPLDQRHDNAMSIVHDFAIDEEWMLLGNAEVRMEVRSSAPVGHVSVKLCDVAPDGTSVLITRGFMDLTHRGVWPSDPWGAVGAAPQPLVPGRWLDLRLELEATTWALLPGHRLRLAIAGTDWPNCWPPSEPFTLSVRRDSVRLALPVVRSLPALTDELVAVPGPDSVGHDGVEWRVEHDVLARETSVHTRYGETYPGTHGTVVTDHYEGHVGISTADLSHGWVQGTSRFTMAFPEGTCDVAAVLDMHSDRDAFHVRLDLTATLDGAPFAARTWTERFPRA